MKYYFHFIERNKDTKTGKLRNITVGNIKTSKMSK